MASGASGPSDPQALLLQLVRHMLAKPKDADVTSQYQYALRVISSNFTPSVEGDEFQVSQRIQRKLARQGRESDAARFAELYRKLQSQTVLKNRWAIMYLLMSLSEDRKSARHRMAEGASIFGQGLPRMATSTPFEPRPGSRQPLPQEQTLSMMHERSHSSGIGSTLSSISGHGQTVSSTSNFSMPGDAYTPAGDMQPVSTRLSRMLIGDSTKHHTYGATPAYGQARRTPAVTFAQSAGDTTDNTAAEVPEASLVRDLIYVFQGVDGQYIRYHPAEDAFCIDHQAGVSKPTRDLVHKLAELGWLFLRVRKYVDSRSQDSVMGIVGQSFCAALQQELTEYYRLLAVLEAQQQQQEQDPGVVDPSTDLTLIRLKVWTYDPIHRMKYLAILVDGCKDKKGGALASAVHSYTLHGDPSVKCVMKHILKLVAFPIKTMLDRWIEDGNLDDKFHEYFVASDPLVKEDRLWHDKYSLRKSMIPSFITMQQARKILLIGKSINFLHQVCHDNSPIKVKGDSDLETKNKYQDTEMLLEQDLDGSFQQVIDSAYRDTSKRLLHVLYTDYKFLDHLKAMRRYLLLGQGDFIQHLMDLLESDLSKPANQLYLHNLTGMLETAVRATNAQYDDVDILNRVDVRLLELSPGDTGWDVFSLDYHVDGPISTVFTPQCKILYLRVFNFLWRAKRMEYVLAQVWRDKMGSTRKLESIAELAPILHQCHILTAEMVHFVNQMQYYINFEVMACSWDELWKKVTEAEDMDHIIAAHEVFLDAIIKGSLLNEESQPLLTQLRTIFDLIIQYQGVQESLYSDSCEELRLREADKQAVQDRTEQGEWGVTAQTEQEQKRRKAKFLREFIPTSRAQLKVLRKSYQDMVQRFLVMLTGHSDDSLRLLAVRLDFNEVYKAKEPMLRSPMAYSRTKKVF
ncbi:gamma-tubulin complex component 3 homolog [Patiria miniata]|uniref:Gamma-tubulin complex component n=1 Tax=Patiria miniata TaxID=46514 RepID=A0A913ZEI3_PATMI|nr:gamma-tubulin complex component 3 homolog [Patiria miniata]XP_038049884.1 gamma-tubulin complex component 3 homolog [Patiria miniata]